MGLSSKVNLSGPIVIQRLDARCLAVMRPAPQVIPRLRQGATEVAPYGRKRREAARGRLLRYRTMLPTLRFCGWRARGASEVQNKAITRS